VLDEPRMTRQAARDARLARRAAAADRRTRQRKIKIFSATAIAAGVALVGLPLAVAAPSETDESAATAAPTKLAPTLAATIDVARDLTRPMTPAPADDVPEKADAAAGADSETDAAAQEVAPSAKALRKVAAQLPVLTEGDSGKVVATLQRALQIKPASGYFGSQTKKAVKKFQGSVGLPKTATVATWTWASLGDEVVAKAEKSSAKSGGYTAGEPATATRSAARPSAAVAQVSVGEPPVLEQTDQGEAVAVVQRALDVTPAEGYFGPVTTAAVKKFQGSVGLPTTGVIAEWTWKSLGANTSAAAAKAHATYGTKFGPGAPAGNSNGSGGSGSSGSGSGGSGSSGSGSGGSGSSGSGSSGGSSGSGTVSVAGRFCPSDNFSYGDGMGAPRGGGRAHAGLDLMGSRGTPIYAIDSGTVTRSGYQSNGALVLDITGSRGMMFYGHFSSINFSQGQSVKAGQVIGFMGDTGSPGAVHLHLEVRPSGWSGSAVDPVPLIRALCG